MKKQIDPIQDQRNIDQYKGTHQRFSLLSNGARNNYLKKFINECISFADGQAKGNIPNMQIEASKLPCDEYWRITIYGVPEQHRRALIMGFNATPLPYDFVLNQIKWQH